MPAIPDRSGCISHAAMIRCEPRSRRNHANVPRVVMGERYATRRPDAARPERSPLAPCAASHACSPAGIRHRPESRTGAPVWGILGEQCRIPDIDAGTLRGRVESWIHPRHSRHHRGHLDRNGLRSCSIHPPEWDTQHQRVRRDHRHHLCDAHHQHHDRCTGCQRRTHSITKPQRMRIHVTGGVP